jgi:uncharacterized YigZ family protein
MPLVVRASGHGELEDRRSRFFSDIVPVESRDEALDVVHSRRAQYPDASHVVYAFAIGASGSETQGLSDDHEPHGTAGRPILDVLLGREITNAAVTVVRYFGGTKLGTGGLVRAYSAAARLAIDDATLAPHVEFRHFVLVIEYAHVDLVKTLLAANDVENITEDYQTSVTVHGSIPAANVAGFTAEVENASRGSAVLQFDS